MRSKYSWSRGFTLIELLIVIAIIAILAGVVFVALNPLVRFQDARDSRRFADVSAVLSAIRVNQVDSGGKYVYGVRHDAAAATGSPFMIIAGTSTTTSGCNVASCGAVTASNRCAHLQHLADAGYLGTVPISPNGSGNWSAPYSGYWVQVNSNNSVTVGACEAEHTSAISITR